MRRRFLILAVAALVPLFGLRGWAAPDDEKKDADTGKETKKADEKKKEEKKAESRVVVFGWKGGLSEPPPQEDLFSFGPQGESLKDVVARLRKAAEDDSVKAL